MPRIAILTEPELRALMPLDRAAVDCVAGAFVALDAGGVAMPPILRLDIPAHNGEVDVKTAHVPGLDRFAIKISPGFFDNPSLGLASVNGLMVLFSARTGLAEALLLDNGFLTDLRTAAAGAVAAMHLARADAAVAAVLGAGVQAALQLEALTLVRPIREARIWARDPHRAKAAAARLTDRLGLPVTAAAAAPAAVDGADIVVTTTPASEPILRADWLAPGQHVTAMGSDAEHKNELEPAVLARADRYVPDSRAQTARLGELHHALAAGAVAETVAAVELGALCAGTVRGREADEWLTVADLTGTGVQDTAIANLAADRAVAAGVGTAIDT